MTPTPLTPPAPTPDPLPMLNAWQKGVVYSFLASVALPLLEGLQTALQTGYVNWLALGSQALLLFVGFLIGFLMGVLHYPDGSTVYVLPFSRKP